MDMSKRGQEVEGPRRARLFLRGFTSMTSVKLGVFWQAGPKCKS